jgi:hypothetical protein
MLTVAQMTVMYTEQKMTSVQIATVANCNWKQIIKKLRQAGIPIRRAGWRESHGYKNVKAPTGHPNAHLNGQIAVHRLVATETTGRPLAVGELVHHINGQPQDNRPENLVITTRAGHNRLHDQLEKIAYRMMELGMVVFRNGKYVLNAELAER